jgi:GTP-binding protein EngB required for normal cell division
VSAVGGAAVSGKHAAGASVEQALRTLASLELLPRAQRHLAEETADKLAGAGLYVAVIGEFNRGKTTLINALLGAEVLPTGVLPVTAVPALVRFGKLPRATLRRVDGSDVAIDIGDIHRYLTEQANPGNRKKVREVNIEYPAAVLATGLILVDTPGTGSVHHHNTQVTVDFLPRVDVALIVLSVDAPLAASEARLLEGVAQTAARIAICLNKVDRVTPSELQEAIDFVGTRARSLSSLSDVTVFAISARDGGVDRGVAALAAWLTDEVGTAQSALSTQRGVRVATTLLSLVDATLRLEAAAAVKPAQEAEAARAAFATARAALATAVDEESTLLRAASRRATETVIEPRAAELRQSLPSLLLAATDEAWPDGYAAAAASWRHDVGAALVASMRGPVDRHTERVQELVARFVAEVGHAFGVTLPTALDMSPRLDVEAVRVDLADDPGALAMGVRQLRARVPGGLGAKWRERARREQAIESADRLAGRLRYATLQSVDRTTRAWIREADESSQGLSQALAGALARAESAVELRHPATQDATDVLARVESVRHSLLGV